MDLPLFAAAAASRNLRLTRPLCVFDIESTGTDIMNDRIVDLAIVKVDPSGSEEIFEWRFHPGMPIPPASSAVHGIFDADVVDCPRFHERASEVLAVLRGCDLGGYNARQFDVPMLEMEMGRAGASTDWLADSLIVDPKEIFHAREPRDLTAALRFYCQEQLVGAHGAKADAVATVKVLRGQLRKYADLPVDLETLAGLHAPKNPFVDPTRKLRRSEDGRVVINFGQHKGKSLEEMAKTKRDYLEWMLQGEWHERVKTAIRQALEARR